MNKQEVENKARKVIYNEDKYLKTLCEEHPSLGEVLERMVFRVAEVVQKAEQNGYLQEVLLQLDLEETRNKLAFEKGVLHILEIIRDCRNKNKLDNDPTLDLITSAIYEGRRK